MSLLVLQQKCGFFKVRSSDLKSDTSKSPKSRSFAEFQSTDRNFDLRNRMGLRRIASVAVVSPVNLSLILSFDFRSSFSNLVIHCKENNAMLVLQRQNVRFENR